MIMCEFCSRPAIGQVAIRDGQDTYDVSLCHVHMGNPAVPWVPIEA